MLYSERVDIGKTKLKNKHYILFKTRLISLYIWPYLENNSFDPLLRYNINKMLCFKFKAFLKHMDLIYYYLTQKKTFLKFKVWQFIIMIIYCIYNFQYFRIKKDNSWWSKHFFVTILYNNIKPSLHYVY